MENKQEQYHNHNQMLSPRNQLSDTPQLNYSYSGISNTSSTDYFLHTARSFNQQLDHPKFLQIQELYDSMKNLAKPLQIRMYIDPQLILYLLYQYKWNKEKLEEQYYVKHAQSFKKMDIILKNEELKEFYGNCPVCLDNNMLIKAIFCYHAYCKNCWAYYIKEKLMNGQIFFSCMDQCPDCPILQSFIKHHTPNLIENFLKKIGINYCLANSNVTYCPSEKCSLFCQKPFTVSQSKVQCPCGLIYCFYCRKQLHYPLSCQDLQKWYQLVNNEENNCQWIHKNTTICPKCKSNVQKSIGCNYIKCICGSQFCYKCSKQWDSNHKGTSECPRQKFKKQHSEGNYAKQFCKVYQDILLIGAIIKKDTLNIQQSIKIIPDQKIRENLKTIKNDVAEARQVQKWCKVGQYLYQGKPLEKQIQDDYKKSIFALIESINAIKRLKIHTAQKQIYSIEEQILSRQQHMQKCKGIYIQAWRSTL